MKQIITLAQLRAINQQAAFNQWAGMDVTQVYTACELYAVQNGEEKLVATGETLLTPVGDGG